MRSRLVGGVSGGSSLLLLLLGALVVTGMGTSSGGTPDDNGLVDHPIAADSVTYLDGRWMASAELMPPRPASCSFLPNTDFHKGKRAGGHLKAITQQQCCAECAQELAQVAMESLPAVLLLPLTRPDLDATCTGQLVEYQQRLISG